MDSCSLSFDGVPDMGMLLSGGLAGEEEELSYFDGVHLEYGMVDSRLILLDQKALPSDARGLELLDILLINGFSTESLTEDQRTAILQWVERGGTLLLGTGQEAEKVLGDFPKIWVESGSGDMKKRKWAWGGIRPGFPGGCPGGADVR